MTKYYYKGFTVSITQASPYWFVTIKSDNSLTSQLEFDSGNITLDKAKEIAREYIDSIVKQ